MYKCYDYIFGFSQHDCECNDEGRPDDYNKSLSGLFLDDLAPITQFLSGSPCNGDIWQAFKDARTEGIKRLVADSNALLAKKYRLKRKPLADTALGTIKARDLATVDKNYTVTILSCSPIRSGYMTITNIGAVFSSTGAIQVDLYDNEVGFLQSIPLNTVSNKHTRNDVNIELPLHSKYVGAKEYYFVVQYDADNAPKDNLIKCACGGWTPEYNKAAPYYYNIGAKKSAAWSDYVMVGGTTINSISDLDELPDRVGNEMYGLVLEVKAGCNVSEVLCKDSLDFKGNPLALSLAFAARFATALELAKKIQTSTELTRANMIDGDIWDAAVEDWDAMYNEHINYIVNESDRSGTDCLGCKDIIKMTTKGLFA